MSCIIFEEKPEVTIDESFKLVTNIRHQNVFKRLHQTVLDRGAELVKK
jgi:hypothetical protein